MRKANSHLMRTNRRNDNDIFLESTQITILGGAMKKNSHYQQMSKIIARTNIGGYTNRQIDIGANTFIHNKLKSSIECVLERVY